MPLILAPQEIPLTDPHSRYFFRPSVRKPFVATPAALDCFGIEMIVACLRELRAKAEQHDGLDKLQVFRDADTENVLWFIEDDDGGAITALLPSDY